MKSISIKMTWAGTLNVLLALYENGDRKFAREQLQNMARLADFGADASESLRHIADMTDRDGNAIEMHREELRAIARTALRPFDGHACENSETVKPVIGQS
jgi:hypothetical protein